jgi:hypothetical protein
MDMVSSTTRTSIKFRWAYIRKEKKRVSSLKNEITLKKLFNTKKIIAKDKISK